MRIYRRAGIVGSAVRVTAACLLYACAHFGAPGPVAADRPGYTDTPVALPSHAGQLEVGVTDDHSGQPGARTEYVSAGETLLRLGVGANVELRLFGNSYAVRTVDNTPRVRGMEDPKVGAKLNLRAIPDSIHSWAPNIALLAATTLPTGASGLTAGSAQPEAKIALNWTTPTPFSLYSNVGYGTIYNETGRAQRGWTSVASWWAVNPRASVFVEGLAFARLSGQGTGTAARDADAGITWLVTDRFQLDLRAGRGFGSESSTERFIGVGLARRW